MKKIHGQSAFGMGEPRPAPREARRRLFIALPVLMALAACGQKGPLHLPEDGDGNGDARATPASAAPA